MSVSASPTMRNLAFTERSSQVSGSGANAHVDSPSAPGVRRARPCGAGTPRVAGDSGVERLTLGVEPTRGRDNGAMHADHSEPRETVPAPQTSSAAEPAVERRQPKSAYELPSKKNTVLRNMVWALVLTMAVVVVIGVGFFGVGSDLEREPLENSAVDVAASAERAEAVAPFPVAVPQLGEGWSERSARFTDGASPRWMIRYTSPQDSLITVVQESEVSAAMLSSALPDNTVMEELEIGGARCQLLNGGEQGAEQLGITCEGDGWGLVTYGAADQAELEEVAGAAVSAIG